ncbi:glycosyltransferase family 4 protein [Hydrocarboniphaga sp.]|uniref:glycosyltransferase family 4 protein n=1 Tax=Hydrocarboniphaga sp. TaxID=2033016 RepID=UPI003D09FF2F
MPFNITLISIGRFHHFHLARQLEKHGLLKDVWTGYPLFKLKSEEGIPTKKIRSFPWLQAPYMARGRLGFHMPTLVERQWEWLARTTLDLHVSRRLMPGGTLIALSGNGLRSGTRIKQTGGSYFCDRGSTHIRFQDQILREEYSRWKIPFSGIDPRILAREEAEYEMADCVSVPSKFVADSFVKMGYAREKIFMNPYGARLGRFRRVAEAEKGTFTVLFVGQVSLRKGFLYLLRAFSQLNHPRKKLKVIGSIAPEVRPLLAAHNLSQVEFMGVVPNEQLLYHYSAAHVMVLPSIEEGLAMVIGEALACGCPVVASENTGGRNFFTDSIEGFIVSPRATDELVQRLEELSQNEPLRQRMSEAALRRVAEIGGWDSYGERWLRRLAQMDMHLTNSSVRHIHT